jgi:hypothetical protein
MHSVSLSLPPPGNLPPPIFGATSHIFCPHHPRHPTPLTTLGSKMEEGSTDREKTTGTTDDGRRTVVSAKEGEKVRRLQHSFGQLMTYSPHHTISLTVLVDFCLVVSCSVCMSKSFETVLVGDIRTVEHRLQHGRTFINNLMLYRLSPCTRWVTFRQLRSVDDNSCQMVTSTHIAKRRLSWETQWHRVSCRRLHPPRCVIIL